ncbi:MAG: hydantoinase/oxoprolinase family protein [Proteobacteria bacterium]|nr:hydantoinase/oxoprolinase family protein [Pseudomonadota bacterium]MBU1058186.1 hydantoinase/oxoprolinase family protein [Pseudomonadota bacterium]
MSHYIIGIDTGGTYTDAVLLDPKNRTVLATAKEPTTHHRLALSTGRALASLLKQSGISKNHISHLAISTTLATNAVVEKKGARVAAFIIGYVKHFRLPIAATVFIKGGHDIMGTEEEPLDIDNIVDTIHGLRNDVDAYAICSAMSMVDPTHELVTEKAISMIDPKPVFCSHKISQHAGMRERAATAALHAKLMPLMEGYVAGVQAAMLKNGLHCPVFLIAGNGDQVTIHDAIEQAGITVASGPACSAGFGASQGVEYGLVVDVGGTTTDIAMIEDGKTVLSPEGCQVGEWQTHVEAVDMFTGGIGGDSHVLVDEKGEIHLGPSRVIPLSMAHDFPEVRTWLGAEHKAKCISLLPGFDASNQTDVIIMALAGAGPSTADTIREKTGFSGVPLDKQLEQLARSQIILETGFTPTDALHVLGKIDIGDKARAKAGAEVLGTLLDMSAKAFCKKIIKMTETKIEDLIIDYIIHHYWGKSLTSFISTRSDHPVLGVEFNLKIPLIGIGAAARYLLPKVARRLGTTVEFPEYCEVGNAVGAALLGSK